MCKELPILYDYLHRQNVEELNNGTTYPIQMFTSSIYKTKSYIKVPFYKPISRVSAADDFYVQEK